MIQWECFSSFNTPKDLKIINTPDHLRKNKSQLYRSGIIVGSAFLIMGLSYGLYGTFGVFLNPLLDEFNWTSAVTSGAYSVSQMVFGLMGIIVGALTDRFGPRLVMTICGLFLGLGYISLSYINSVWQLYLCLGVIIGIGMSGVWVPILSSIAKWFDNRRSLMSGIVIAGASVGLLVTPPAATQLIVNYDWRLSYLVLGIIILVVMVSATQLMCFKPVQRGSLPVPADKNPESPATPDGTDSWRKSLLTKQFCMFFLIVLAYGYSIGSMMVHIVPHAIDTGISAVSAANVMAAMCGTSIISNYALGSLADRIGNRQVFIISFTLMTLGLVWLYFAGELWMLYCFAVIFGFGMGGLTAESPLVADLFGLQSHGVIYGFIHISFTFGGAIGPFVSAFIFDVTDNYRLAFLVCAVLNISVIILTTRLRARKNRY